MHTLIELHQPLYRRLIPWIMVVAYLSVTVIAGYYVFQIRNSQHVQVTDQLEGAIEDQVAAWENELIGQLSEWMENAASSTDKGSLRQRRYRDREPWFDALYMWARVRDGPIRDRKAPQPFSQMIFPVAVPDDRAQLMARMCLIRAKIQASNPDSDPEDVAQQYVVGCRHESLTVRLIAAIEAAQILKNHGLYAQALAKLNTAGVPDELTLVAAARQQIHPRGLVAFHFQRAEILLALKETEKAMALYDKVGDQICQLDAPDAQLLLQWVRYPIIAELRRHKQRERAARMEMQLLKLERRVAGSVEIEKRILPAPRSAATEMPRFIYDQYSETPYLLYYGCCYGLASKGEVGVALQLEQAKLIEDFLSMKGIERVRKWITVTDASGAWVRGVRRGGPIVLSVPFTRTLSHLRIGVREEAIKARLENMEDQWITTLVVIGICLLLGFSALTVQVRASWRQRELLDRQREFTTRVTHELKTPLAGIRVMAENLELGAFRDEAQLQHMARLILEETDRLTARVDEVLQAAKEHTIPNPEPFDPEESVLEAIDMWGPRLENVGLKFEADLHATPEVVGDMRAIRDAVGCLLDNAIKYRREDAQEPAVWLVLESINDKVVRITVTDNGLGVPPAMRKSIFDRFVRVEGPNRGKGGGHGLGLSQVAAVAKAHKGSITCEAGVDGGAKFILRLPAA